MVTWRVTHTHTHGVIEDRDVGIYVQRTPFPHS